ncbi:hypothetical protein [Catenovulum sediminis]|uniref:Uncharacterized protein n=1 Tax=Catenovulum sediminis TaxID=1740262 RepID=A0ABV1RHD4_9ALTE
MTESCNCFDEVLDRVKSHVQEQLPVDATEFECDWQDRSIFLSAGEYAPVNPKVEYKFRKTKRNNEPAKNLTKSTVNITASHCCFCGRKYERPEKGGAE